MYLRNFQYFVAAAKEENFSRAAEHLHIAQSALSRQIKMLEDDLGVSLFVRSRSRVRLTDAGRAYFEDITKIIREVNLANDRARRHGQGQLGTLQVGIHNVSIRNKRVEQSINLFRASYPGIELVLVEGITKSHADALRAETLDAAFVIDVPEKREDDFIYLTVGANEPLLVLPKPHPLASRKWVHLADLVGERFIWIRRSVNPPIYDSLMRACVSGGLTPRVVQHVLSHDLCPKLVAAGIGLAMVPSSVAAKDENVVFKRIADLSVAWQIDLAWRHDNRSPALKSFIEVVNKCTRAASPATAKRAHSRSAVGA
jgi:DNA-binding transcriptional LysR family regulator